MEDLRNNLAPIEFFVREIIQADGTRGNQVPDLRQNLNQGTLQVLDGSADKSSLIPVPRAGDVGIKASSPAEIHNPASYALAANRYNWKM
jgi:hypothetical protein